MYIRLYIFINRDSVTQWHTNRKGERGRKITHRRVHSLSNNIYVVVSDLVLALIKRIGFNNSNDIYNWHDLSYLFILVLMIQITHYKALS